MHTVIQESTAILEEQFTVLEMCQNIEKTEHMPVFMGTGQNKVIREFKRRNEEDNSGKCKQIDRYLGSWLDVEGRAGASARRYF